MIINTICPDCGREIKLRINKVIRLEERVVVLEKENSRLRDTLQSYTTPSGSCDVMDDLLKMMSGKGK